VWVSIIIIIIKMFFATHTYKYVIVFIYCTLYTVQYIWTHSTEWKLRREKRNIRIWN
jgi:hypothetical protein